MDTANSMMDTANSMMESGSGHWEPSMSACMMNIMQYWEQANTICAEDICTMACKDAYCSVEWMMADCPMPMGEMKKKDDNMDSMSAGGNSMSGGNGMMDWQKEWDDWTAKYMKECGKAFTCPAPPTPTAAPTPTPEPTPTAAPPPPPKIGRAHV